MSLNKMLAEEYLEMAIKNEWDDVRYLEVEEIKQMNPVTPGVSPFLEEDFFTDEEPRVITMNQILKEIDELERSLAFSLESLKNGIFRYSELTEIRSDISYDRSRLHALKEELERMEVDGKGNNLVRRIPREGDELF